MSSTVDPTLPPALAAKLRHYPAGTAEALAGWRRHAAPADLAHVVQAILLQHVATPPANPQVPLPASTRLLDDLGMDSLGVAEAVFAAEDLLGVHISNQEMRHLTTLGELTNFLRAKAERPTL
jgi:acyl carrier protein